MSELSGDGAMSAANRVRWLVTNTLRNVAGCFATLAVERVRADAPTRARARNWYGSPSRLISDMVIERELAKALRGRPVEILDIGCGSGLSRRHMIAAGLEGRYLGIDIDDRFDHQAQWPELACNFHKGDAHIAELGRADLVFSFSALEHIPRDEALIARLRATLKPGGMQFHVVPAGWALPAYLWHGYRQYHRRAVKQRFDMTHTRVIAIGGPGSLALHTFMIAVPEILLHVNLRTRWPGLYGQLMAWALFIDGIVPFMPTSYVIIETSGEAS